MVIPPHKSVQWFLVVSQFFFFLGSLLAGEMGFGARTALHRRQ